MSIGVGIIGWGVMGRTHAASYLRAARSGRCVLRAVASPELRAAAAGNIAELGKEVVLPADLEWHTDAVGLLADERIQVVSICTPTDTHVELAEAALAAGKHVLVEKPVALRAADVERLEAAAARAGRLCMPAMCMRFWPGWPWLREHVRLGTFGEVRSARFERLGEGPSWNRAFYDDVTRSGGPLFDLHVHDVDFVHWCFGAPGEVRVSGTRMHVHADFAYPTVSGPLVVEGGYIPVAGFGFRMRYRVIFEDAVAEFRHDARPPLQLTFDGATRAIPLGTESAYDLQVRHILSAVRNGRTELRASLRDAVLVTRCLEEEARQLAGATASAGTP